MSHPGISTTAIYTKPNQYDQFTTDLFSGQEAIVIMTVAKKEGPLTSGGLPFLSDDSIDPLSRMYAIGGIFSVAANC